MRVDYKYPRTMDEAFPGHDDYACALEVPAKRVNSSHLVALFAIFFVLAWIFQ